MNILAKIFGTKNEREVKKLWPIAQAVGAQEGRFRDMSDEALREQTAVFRARLEQEPSDERRDEALEDLLPEAFAVVREAGRRTLKMRHFDVQLMGGAVLHQGKIAEMRTGEGKTLVATLPVYLNALMGKGVHVITVNDYLARRDSEWMGRIYEFLGLTVGVIQHDMDDAERQQAYRADITYGTNNEFGFDYLRDNMKFSRQECVQRGHHFAIVDEVDSILIDEARTPLIISGPSEESTDVYYKVDKIIPRLKRDVDYLVDEKAHTVVLTEVGIGSCEKLLNVENLYEPKNVELLHHVNQGLRAHNLYRRDVEYMVKDGQVVIVDEFTGRLMPGRRWSDGLHQAVEAKEGVRIERENQTLATITLQNYFRMYKKLAGMTGTAMTEAEEFYKIYKLEVVEIPTNRDMIRIDSPDLIYRTQEEKFKAIVDDIAGLYEKGRPVLVGTVSIEKSEHISALLKRRGVPHNVLNAKYHEKEAEIVAQAGRKAAITIATNMAGRGTDILLGGNPEFMAREELRKTRQDWKEVPKEEYLAEVARMEAQVKEEHEEVVALGGLHIIGTERHEARRIDNQLRGRAGRQGDPGSSRFFLSLDDDLMRIYGGERLSNIMQTLGMEEGVPIESRLITRQIERAQKYVEAHNFQIRKHLLEYDEVMNKQREAIYGMRNGLLDGEDQKEFVLEAARGVMEDIMEVSLPAKARSEEWDIPGFEGNIRRVFGFEVKSLGLDLAEADRETLQESLWNALAALHAKKEETLGETDMRHFERFCILHIADGQWKDHLLALDHLREGIGLRGYGQKDPLVEYKKESYSLFEELWGRIDEESVRFIWLVDPVFHGREEEAEARRRREASRRFSEGRGEEGEAARGGSGKPKPVVKKDKVGRNDPCSCGSGKKYKYCCGAR